MKLFILINIKLCITNKVPTHSMSDCRMKEHTLFFKHWTIHYKKSFQRINARQKIKIKELRMHYLIASQACLRGYRNLDRTKRDCPDYHTQALDTTPGDQPPLALTDCARIWRLGQI